MGFVRAISFKIFHLPKKSRTEFMMYICKNRAEISMEAADAVKIKKSRCWQIEIRFHANIPILFVLESKYLSTPLHSLAWQIDF